MLNFDCQELTEKISNISNLCLKINFAISERKNVVDALAGQAEIIKILEEFYVSPEEARELMQGEFIGPEEVKKVFGLEGRIKVPLIPFSKEELEQAQKLGQFLIFRTSEIPIDKLALPNVKKTLEKPPQTRWALVSKEIIPDSTNKNYLEQTELIIQYLQEKVFAGREIPVEYQEAIQEFESQKEELQRLLRIGSSGAAKKLANLRITQLIRQSLEEALYDLEVCYQTKKEYLLTNRQTWTNSRDYSTLVHIGDFDARGVIERSFDPGGHGGGLGVSLSRSL